MAKSKRRQKSQAERAKRRAAKFARYEQRKDKLPNPETKFGKRWWARRGGEGMNPRSHERKPWFYEAVTSAFAEMARTEASKQRAAMQKAA